ncbi:MAG TPA: cytidine deaminase [Terriglobales bacterium]|nr:cytidine deaminase [Terriglobales bacterium]
MSDHTMTRRSALSLLGSAAIAAALPFPLLADDFKSTALRQTLPKFTEKSRSLLLKLMQDPGYSGQITAADADALAQNEGTTIEELMSELIPLARSYSHAPISNFFVGCLVRGASGCLYTGANIEIPGQCLGFAVHAEQAAVSNAYMHGENAVTALAVGGAPCGHCRQFINEASPDGEIQILNPNKPPTRLSAILPSAFGPAALGMKHGAFPIREANLTLVSPAADPIVAAALQAARNAYAPYSTSPSGVAIRSAQGRIFRGSYIENVAFNPSLSPLQIALAQMIAAGQHYSAIAEVTLVEVQGAKISQKAVTETVLGAIVPTVKLKHVFAHPTSA